MADYEVPKPIINAPFEEVAWHRHIEEGQVARETSWAVRSGYFYRDPKAPPGVVARRRGVWGFDAGAAGEYNRSQVPDSAAA